MATYKISIITYSEGKKFTTMRNVINYSLAKPEDIKKVKKFLTDIKAAKW